MAARDRETRVLKVDPRQPDPRLLHDAAAVLCLGGLVAFPTETVYGLGAHALNESAIADLFEAKGRPSTDPVIVHVASFDDVLSVACEIPDSARPLAERFWPGPLTLILPKQSHVPAAVTAGLDTVGVRVPSHPVARALLQAADVPVAAPSANSFSRPSPTRAEHVLEDLGGAIDIVIDGGPTDIGVESTVLDLTTSPPTVRRPGGVPIEAIRELLPDVVPARQAGDAGRPQLAPGQLLKHYAPRARVTLYVGDSAAVSRRVATEVRSVAGSGARIGVLAPEEDLMAMAPDLASLARSGRVRFASYGSRRDVQRAARELFNAMRTLDAAGVDEIFASAPEPLGLGQAILDRLTRAAEGRVKRA
jgi:L-threonylcarbamoyladenylate synthase